MEMALPMNESPKRRIAVVVGSGFSASLTTGESPLIGNKPIPTLAGLAEAMLEHLDAVSEQLPFPREVIGETHRVLEQNQKLPQDTRFDFEQLLSLVAIKSGFASNSDISQSRTQLMAKVQRCLIYLIPSLFAERLAIDGKLQKNRNLFYSVRDKARVKAIQVAIRYLVDQYDVTFITFNYDGLIEAFLDCDLGISGPGQKPVFRYFPEISHGVRMVMPEYVFGSRDTRDFSKLGSVPRVLKPHGSMHFYRVREAMRNLTNSPQIVALHPRFDIGFNPKTMQRDIPSIEFWEYADPIPFIIPPVLNKDSFLAQDYAKVVFGQAERALVDADAIIVLGFSIPRSDLHINALLEYVAEQRKEMSPIGLVYLRGDSDKTLSNWHRIFGESAVTEIEDRGMPTKTTEEITQSWKRLLGFAQTASAK
jgi:hypothetical protein